MPNTLRIAIIGYGIAGIAAAIGLRRQGHQIEHFEAATEPGTSGAGLLLHPPTIALLDHLDIGAPLRTLGARVSRLWGQNSSGRCIMDFRYDHAQADCFAIGIQRRALFNLLRDQDPGRDSVCCGVTIAHADENTGMLRDGNDGRHGPFDIIIAADGANSATRRQRAMLVRRDHEYPWAALVCLLEDQELCGETLSQHFHGTHHVSYWPVGTDAALAPRRISIAIKVSATDARSRQRLGPWRDRIASLCPTLRPALHSADSDTPMLPYIYRDVVLRRYTHGRLVVIGDAAHSMSPQLGQGLLLALRDAQCLAQSLARDADPVYALHRFDSERREHVTRIQRLSRWLTPIFQSDNFLLANLRDTVAGPLSRSAWTQTRMTRMLCDGE